MKNLLHAFSYAAVAFLAFFLITSCGGGSDSVSTNEHLGELPGIAKNYSDKMVAKKEEIKLNTDQDKAFKLYKESEILEEEAEKKVEEHLVAHPINNIPFEMISEYPFTIKDIAVKRCSDTRIEFKANVTMTKNYPKRLFAYIKAVDVDGNQLTRKNGVMGESSFSKKSFKEGEEIELSGSVDGPADLVNFEKLLFVTKEEYNKRIKI
ncbi:MAG: hypothetical protein KUG68_06510 [Flavobacteriaceae bacterium]|nr:hypothetical protein [Flavobacteriaceae bacterium]